MLLESNYVKSVRIRSFPGPYFPAFALNRERYRVSLRIQSKCRKYGPENSEYGHFLRSEYDKQCKWMGDVKDLVLRNTKVYVIHLTFFRCKNISYQRLYETIFKVKSRSLCPSCSGLRTSTRFERQNVSMSNTIVRNNCFKTKGKEVNKYL